MNWRLATRLVWRDLRASPQLLWIVAALVLGVATFAAVGTARQVVLETLQRDAAVLMGGDARLRATGAPITPEEKAGVVPDDARTSDIVSVNTILKTDTADVTVALKGVDGAYPLYGELRLDPPMPVSDALWDRGIIVAPGVLTRLGVEVGDPVRIGDADFTIRTTLVAEPDRTGGVFQIGPRVIVALDDLAATGILREGSVARYQTRIALADTSDRDGFVEKARRAAPDARFEVRSASAAQPGLEGLIDRLATFLTLSSLAALATGGLAVALAARTHLAGKLTAMATLRALGGRPGWVAGLYGLQLALLGALGLGLGIILGALMPFGLALLPPGLLPVQLEPRIVPQALFAAAAIGALVLACFVWLPLAGARAVSPASLFRGGTDLADAKPPRRDRLIALGLAIALTALVIAVADDGRLAATVLLALAGGTAVLVGLVLALQRLAGALAGVAPPRLRLPLRELARPGGETTPTVLALALGLGLLAMVAQTGQVIDRELDARVPARAPSTIFIDIQPDMRERFETIVQDAGAEVLQLAPYLRARLVRIAGVPVAEVEIGEEAAWSVRGDRGITWSAEPPADERLVAGRWWSDDYRGPPLVAIEDEAATAYGVDVGDTLTFNVLGRLVEAEIAAIRPEIDWSRGRLEFLFTFSPGLIDQAPHSVIASVDVALDERPALLATLSDALPTVTPLLIDETLAAASAVLDRIRAAVLVVAGLSLVSGLVVLAASLAAVRTRQRRAAAILKALGAGRRDLVRTFLVEHAGLGALAGLAALVLGIAGAWLIAAFALGLPFVFAPFTALGIIGLGLALTTLTGLLGLARLAAQSAQPLLRAG